MSKMAPDRTTHVWLSARPGSAAFAALLATCLLSLPNPASAEDARRSTLADAAWLAGRWVGEGLGGEAEETWAPAAGGQMVGHFRLVRTGAPAFYEIMLLDEVEGPEGGVRMRVKHFDPDFTGWEERDAYHTFETAQGGAKPGELLFSGLTLRLVSEDEAEFVVRIRYADGVRDEVLRMRRQPM